MITREIAIFRGMNPTETSLTLALMLQQRQYINAFFDQIQIADVDKVVEACLGCKGLIVVTGIGKSGIIAEKVAMTLISTGTRAMHLPAINFLHGDIGAIGEDDLVLLFSKSGETDELVNLLPRIRKKGSKSIAVVSETSSRLARGADLVVQLPVEKELCPFDLAPTTSTTVQLLFGDLLAMTLMQEKGFTIENYADNHPSGSIGKQIAYTVRDLMQTNLPLCKSSDRLVDVIVELSNKRCGCLLIVDREHRLEGIFTDGDLRRALEKEGSRLLEKRMKEVMNRVPITVGPDQLAHTAMKLMQNERFVMVAPVTENHKVVGLIRMHDIIHQGI